MTREPDPPVDVRIVYADGVEQPVDCVYAGWAGGYHQWVVASPLRPVAMVEMHAAELPGFTSVVVARYGGPYPQSP
jgi:hypothetical protein